MKIDEEILREINQPYDEEIRAPGLSSTASTKLSLEAIRNGDAGLTDKRLNLLKRAPNSNDWAAFKKDSITIKDLAYLSAATKHEFALLRGKRRDILFHGIERHCNFDDALIELLKRKKYKLIAHTHPDYGNVTASAADRAFLRMIGQKDSLIISYITGEEVKFSSNYFDDY